MRRNFSIFVVGLAVGVWLAVASWHVDHADIRKTAYDSGYTAGTAQLAEADEIIGIMKKTEALRFQQVLDQAMKTCGPGEVVPLSVVVADTGGMLVCTQRNAAGDCLTALASADVQKE